MIVDLLYGSVTRVSPFGGLEGSRSVQVVRTAKKGPVQCPEWRDPLAGPTVASRYQRSPPELSRANRCRHVPRPAAIASAAASQATSASCSPLFCLCYSFLVYRHRVSLQSATHTRLVPNPESAVFHHSGELRSLSEPTFTFVDEAWQQISRHLRFPFAFLLDTHAATASLSFRRSSIALFRLIHPVVPILNLSDQPFACTVTAAL